MNVKDFSEIYEYIIDSRQRFLAGFRDMGWEEFARNREATWKSSLGVFVHLVDVEDSYLHLTIQGKRLPSNPAGKRLNSLFKSFKDVEEFEREVTAKTRAFLTRLKEDDLRREVTFWPQHKRVGTMSDVLINIFVDELEHLGELICLMWQRDVELPYKSWLRLHSKPA